MPDETTQNAASDQGFTRSPQNGILDGREPLVRCPDGSWSKFQSRRCTLPMGHRGPHKYLVRDLRTGRVK